MRVVPAQRSIEMAVLIRREEVARYGLSVGDIQDVIESAIGGATVTTTVERRERYPVNVRYLRDFRTDIPNLNRALVSTPEGAQIPCGQKSVGIDSSVTCHYLVAFADLKKGVDTHEWASTPGAGLAP